MMKGLLKFIGGAVIGAAVGSALYLMLTDESDQGIVNQVKSLVTDMIEEGQAAAAQRRSELESELQGKDRATLTL